MVGSRFGEMGEWQERDIGLLLFINKPQGFDLNLCKKNNVKVFFKVIAKYLVCAGYFT